MIESFRGARERLSAVVVTDQVYVEVVCSPRPPARVTTKSH
jgi:hypothetical protein